MRWSSQTYLPACPNLIFFFFKGQYYKIERIVSSKVYVWSLCMYVFVHHVCIDFVNLIWGRVYIYMLWKEFWNMSLLLTECDCPEVILWTGCYITTYPLPGFKKKLIIFLHRAKALQIHCLHPVLVIPFKIILGRLNWKVIVLEFSHCSFFLKFLFKFYSSC